MEEKICLKCLEPKPIGDFYPTRFGGTINECKECKAEYHRVYRANNREHMRALNRNSKARFKERKTTEENDGVFRERKCAKRNCDEPAVKFEDLVIFCKSHAYDYIFKIEDV